MNKEIKQMKKFIFEKYESDGVQGGSRGCTVNFATGKITNWNGKTTTITKDKATTNWVIMENIKYYIERDVWLKAKLTQTETVWLPIEDGYKESKPPSEFLLEKYKEEIEDIKIYLEDLETLSIKYNSQDSNIDTRLKSLKTKWTKLNAEFILLRNTGSDGDIPSIEIILGKMRDIETTFETFGFKVQKYK